MRNDYIYERLVQQQRTAVEGHARRYERLHSTHVGRRAQEKAATRSEVGWRRRLEVALGLILTHP